MNLFQKDCLHVRQLKITLIYLFISLWITSSYAQSFIDFTSLFNRSTESIESNILAPSNQKLPELNYFEYLQSRFANQRLDEVLFLERPAISGPRLSVADVKRVNLSVQNILQSFPNFRDRINMNISFQSFRFDQKPSYIKQTDIDHFYELYPQILVLRNHYGGQFNEERIKVAMSEWMKDKGTDEKAKLLADFLILTAIPENSFKNFKGVASSVILLHWNHILKTAINLGTKLQLPNKILQSLLQKSSFSEFKSKDILKGLVAMPMTTEEALFKGVGPGECVRTSLFRYADSFFQDSIVIKILKDGVEIGYITIYQTKNEKNGQKIWFLETIQAPILAYVKNKSETMRYLISTLQALSIQSNALLAVPANSMNTYNFKEIVSSLIGMNEYVSGVNTYVDYENKSEVNSLNKFVSTNGFATDRSIMEYSGYDTSTIINAMIKNKGEVRILSPNHNLDSNSLEKYLNHFLEVQGKNQYIPIESHPPLVKKAATLKALGSNFETKIVIFEIYEKLNAMGDIQGAQEVLQHYLYDYLPKELWQSSFSEKFKYLEYRVNNVPQKETVATGLKADILLSATTWDEFMAVIRLGDRGETFRTLLLQSLNYFVKFNLEGHWPEIYSELLKLTKTSSEDFLLSRIIVDKIQSAEDFLKFSLIASGKSGSMKWDDFPVRSSFLAEESRRFITFSTSEERITFYDNFLKVLREQEDLQVRRDLADTFTRLAELSKLSQIGFNENSGFSKEGLKVYQSIVLNTINRIIKKISIEEFQEQINILPIIVKNFDNEAKVEFCKAFASKYQNIQQLSYILKSVGVNGAEALRPDFFSELSSDLKINILRTDANALTIYISKLKLGSPGSILPIEESKSLNKVFISLNGQPDLVDRIVISLSKQGALIRTKLDIREHRELIENLNAISTQLNPNTFELLNKIFDKKIEETRAKQFQFTSPLKDNSSIAPRCNNLFYRGN